MNRISSILTRIVQFVIFAVILVAGGMTLPAKFRQLHGMERQRDDLQEQITCRKNEIKVLKEKQQRFKTDPSFVEHIARENRRVQPGELVFVFDDDK